MKTRNLVIVIMTVAALGTALVLKTVLAQTGDSKGEYRGLAYRNDADLKAWLAKRPGEAALEPDLPIIDPPRVACSARVR